MLVNLVHCIFCKSEVLLHCFISTFSQSSCLCMHLSVLTFISCLLVPVVVHIQSISRVGDVRQLVPIMKLLEPLSNFKHLLELLSQNASSGATTIIIEKMLKKVKNRKKKPWKIEDTKEFFWLSYKKS